jgi:alcohol dehydrogenase
MSIYLPYGMEYNLHKVGDLIGELLYPLAGPGAYAATRPADRVGAAIAFVRGLNEELKKATGGRHATALRDVVDSSGRQLIPRDMLSVIARTSLGDGPRVWNPEELSYDDAMMVLEAAWEGSPLDLKKIRKGPKKQKF